jgi:hypothetical protein
MYVFLISSMPRPSHPPWFDLYNVFFLEKSVSHGAPHYVIGLEHRTKNRGQPTVSGPTVWLRTDHRKKPACCHVTTCYTGSESWAEIFTISTAFCFK